MSSSCNSPARPAMHERRIVMTKHIFVQHHHEFFEYHGNTMVERIKKGAGNTVTRDWILFDTVEEAQEFFNSNCEGV